MPYSEVNGVGDRIRKPLECTKDLFREYRVSRRAPFLLSDQESLNQTQQDVKVGARLMHPKCTAVTTLTGLPQPLRLKCNLGSQAPPVPSGDGSLGSPCEAAWCL